MTVEKHKIVIDAENATLGRLASYAAKQARLGNDVVIVNCNKIIITGGKNFIMKKYLRMRKMGGSSQKGPRILSSPERILKRTIRGMIGHKTGRGDEAFDKIRCHNEIPEEYKDVKKFKSGRKREGISLKEISKLLKGQND